MMISFKDTQVNPQPKFDSKSSARPYVGDLYVSHEIVVGISCLYLSCSTNRDGGHYKPKPDETESLISM